MAPAIESFRNSFPDLRTMPSVYLLHSLGEMDGGTRMFGDRHYLIFGADVMVAAHDFDDERPFLHHELFHVYHEQFFPSCDKVWCNLWAEGLAVHVAHVLNPEASDSQLLLTAPEPIRAQVDEHLADVICAVQARFDSSDSSDVGALFSFERLSPTVPPRAGYYVGLLIAERVAAGRRLGDLARLPPAEAHDLVRSALDDLADCEVSSAV